MAKIYPLTNFILTKPIEAPKPVIDGLIMPDTIEESATLRRVEVVEIEIGTTPDKIKVGSIIIVPSNIKNEITSNGVKYYLVHVEEILAYEV